MYWMPRITAAMRARPLPGRMVSLPAAQGAAPGEKNDPDRNYGSGPSSRLTAVSLHL